MECAQGTATVWGGMFFSNFGGPHLLRYLIIGARGSVESISSLLMEDTGSKFSNQIKAL